MLLTITRNSVCAGDDCDAPHERKIEVSDRASLQSVIRDILRSGYLPLIAGGEATWLVKANGYLAVTAQQWPDPQYLVDGAAPLRTFLSSEQKIHFRYEIQKDPEIVFREQCVEKN